jgi:hypothetical protein
LPHRVAQIPKRLIEHTPVSANAPDVGVSIGNHPQRRRLSAARRKASE